MSGVIIFLIILGAGCLTVDKLNQTANVKPVKCLVSLEPGTNLLVNETQNNATICARMNSCPRYGIS